jgi:hypothetical protein
MQNLHCDRVVIAHFTGLHCDKAVTTISVFKGRLNMNKTDIKTAAACRHVGIHRAHRK